MQLARRGRGVVCSQTIGALGCLFPTTSPQNATSRENCPKFIVRQGHASHLKLWEVGAIEARNDACIRYTATPGRNEIGKLTGGGQGIRSGKVFWLPRDWGTCFNFPGRGQVFASHHPVIGHMEEQMSPRPAGKRDGFRICHHACSVIHPPQWTKTLHSRNKRSVG